VCSFIIFVKEHALIAEKDCPAKLLETDEKKRKKRESQKYQRQKAE
jgi:hypothetical protein